MQNSISRRLSRKGTIAAIIVALVHIGIVRAGSDSTTGSRADSAQPRRVKALFLGDNGHHQPLERCRQIFTLLGRRGIDVTYTDSLADLNPENLNRFDALLLYANWTSIAPEQEKAL